MLMVLANHSTRIAMAASPAPRNTALIRKSSSTVPLPPSITRENVRPVRTTSSLAPISAQQLRAEQRADDADDNAEADAEDDRLHGGARAPVRILFADAARHGRRGADRQPDRHGVDDRHQRFGEADGGDGVGAEPADEEDVRPPRTPTPSASRAPSARPAGRPRGRWALRCSPGAIRGRLRGAWTRRTATRVAAAAVVVVISVADGPVSTGREGSLDHSDHEPAKSGVPGSPACAMASRLWHAVTPEPQYITASAGARPPSILFELCPQRLRRQHRSVAAEIRLERSD